MTAEWLPSLAKAAGDQGLLTQLYGDLAKLGVSQVGKALSTVLGLGNTILWPVQLLNERARITLEINLESYREKVSKIPEDKVNEVPPEVGFQLLRSSPTSPIPNSEIYAPIYLPRPLVLTRIRRLIQVLSMS